MKKWDKNRFLHFQIGLMLAVGLVVLAFRWSVPIEAPKEMVFEEKVTDEVMVVRTKQFEKVLPPPPKISVSDEVLLEEAVDFLERDLIEPAPSLNDLEEVVPFNDKPITIDLPKPKAPPVPIVEAPEESKDPFIIVENMPFYGSCEGISKVERQKCSDRALMQYLSDQIRYPAIARENGIEGTVVIQFVIDEEGQIVSPEIVRDIGGNCGQEALRVVTKMKDWTAGSQRGRKVKVRMTLPVKFRLSR